MPYVWLGIFVVLLIAEAVTSAIVSVWFLPGALLAMILAFCGVPVSVQIAVFLVLSLILLVLSKTIWKKALMRRPVENTNADALIGKVGVVTVPIDNLRAVGEVLILGQTWTARAAEDTPISAGSKVRILRIEGVKLICEQISE
ncbi:MAG: NfeD family protein [Clostridia bacterium]|nr:NfeD family protein [Clostridia bacterium]